MAAESCSRSDHSIFRKTNAGFTLIELALVVVLVAFLAVSVLLRFFEFSDEARQNAEEGTAGAVISGLRLYGSQSTILGREPRFPDELDSAEPGDASDASPLFEIVLAQGITSGWSKVDSTRYRGQAGNLYVYDNEKGTFTNIGS
ncbi:MAG TPA: prepilin-type N-terminal cleavage/methylation domain-containing protein, partial [bacterium]|nr:prepilin-type N-terminal cleavage/methylation domain-containing protein [bacterium]